VILSLSYILQTPEFDPWCSRWSLASIGLVTAISNWSFLLFAVVGAMVTSWSWTQWRRTQVATAGQGISNSCTYWVISLSFVMRIRVEFNTAKFWACLELLKWIWGKLIAVISQISSYDLKLHGPDELPILYVVLHDLKLLLDSWVMHTLQHSATDCYCLLRPVPAISARTWVRRFKMAYELAQKL